MGESFWDQRIETLPRATLARLQQHRLNWQLRRCWDGSPYYRERFEAAGLDPSMFGDADILTRLPVLHAPALSAEVATAPPYGRLTVSPENWWVEAEPSGFRRVWTDGDVSHRADLAARALWAAGFGTCVEGHVHLWLNTSASVAAIQDGSARISPHCGLTDSQTEAHALWIDRIVGTRQIRPGAHRVFGRPLVAPTIAYECSERQGLHWAEDHFLVEVVDNENRPLPDGERGGIVLTDLTREGSPLVRVPIGTIAALDRTRCGCGRTSARTLDADVTSKL